MGAKSALTYVLRRRCAHDVSGCSAPVLGSSTDLGGKAWLDGRGHTASYRRRSYRIGLEGAWLQVTALVLWLSFRETLSLLDRIHHHHLHVLPLSKLWLHMKCLLLLFLLLLLLKWSTVVVSADVRVVRV